MTVIHVVVLVGPLSIAPAMATGGELNANAIHSAASQ
jgi:hypothetical protein